MYDPPDDYDKKLYGYDKCSETSLLIGGYSFTYTWWDVTGYRRTSIIHAYDAHESRKKLQDIMDSENKLLRKDEV